MKKVEVLFKKERLVAFHQEWMNAKTDEIDCEVNTEVQGTRLQIVINGESYVADIAELANSLIEEVVKENA